MISSSRSRLSYKDRRSHQKKRFRFVGVVLLAILLFLLFSSLVLQPWTLESGAMEPGYPPGTRILVAPYLFNPGRSVWGKAPGRGDIIVLRPPYVEEPHWRFKAVNPLIRFITFQKATIGPHSRMEWENDRVFKRVIGIPGDTVRIRDSVAHVKSAEGEFFISEFEMSGKGYDIQAIQAPAGWDESMPLSGWTDDQSLGEEEFYVLGDDRSASNDSRYWGPLNRTDIKGRAVFTYWPLRYFGRPR